MATGPDFVYNNWRRYKELNNFVVNFMVDAAGSHETSTKVPLSRLIPLAQSLVDGSRASPLQIPARVIQSLVTTITLRKGCASWYQHQYRLNPSPALLEDNRKHQYAIEVLEGVLRILEPHTNNADTATEGKQPEPAFEQQPMPAFAQLGSSFSLEEESSESTSSIGALLPVESAPISTIGSTSLPSLTKPQKKRLGKATAMNEDPSLALYLLLQSLEPIRGFVREKWGDSNKEPSGLIIASIAMNTAISLASRFEDDFLASFKEFGDWEDVMARLLSSAADPGQGTAVKTDESVRGTLYGDLRLPYEQLCLFRTYLNQGRVDETVGDEKIFLNTHFLEISSLDSKEQLPAPDALLSGLRGVLTGRQKISLGVLIGLVALLDERHDLGDYIALGFRRLLATAKVFEDTKKSQLVCEGVIRAEALPENEEKDVLHNVNLANSWIKLDRFGQLQRSQHLGDGLATRQPFAFFKRQTLAAGLLQLAVLLDMRRVGINHADAYGYVRAMAHLYNALRCEKVTTFQWHDMEDFIALHGQDYLIQEYKSEELPAHINRLYLTEGGSSHVLAPHSRGLGESSVQSSKETRKIKSSKIIGALDDMLCPGEDSNASITIEQIEAHLVKRAERKSTSDVKADPLYAKWAKTHVLDPVQLLAILEECLVEESPKLLFNYYALHKNCFSLLRLIGKPIEQKFLAWIPDPPGPKDNMNMNLPMLTRFIFEHDKLYKSGHQTFLKLAAGIMEKFVSKHDGETKIPV